MITLIFFTESLKRFARLLLTVPMNIFLLVLTISGVLAIICLIFKTEVRDKVTDVIGWAALGSASFILVVGTLIDIIHFSYFLWNLISM